MENIRNQSFSKKTKADWEAAAEQSVKGKSVQSLHSSTYENIILKPLYTKDDELPVPDYPGGADFRRGTDLFGEWRVAQRITFEKPEELKLKLREAVERGQTALSFEVSQEIINCFHQIAGDLPNKYPFAINSKWLQQELLSELERGSTEVSGYVAADPLSLFAEGGFISEESLHSWIKKIIHAHETLPQLKTILVDIAPYHNGGANAVQELGIAAAEGVFYLQHFIEKGMDIHSALAKLVFQFSIGGNFFMELAKLRAARIIWHRITELYDVAEEVRGMELAATTSSFTKTVLDPHVNLLRSANEAFAAVLGGIQYLHVEPFDELTGSTILSERIARNIQLILKDEVHIQKVIDPAGGSWYIELLTSQLAEKAWEFFQQIEAKGGMLEVLKSGWLQREIAAVFETRNSDIQTRKQSMIGTNVYANLSENVVEKKNAGIEVLQIEKPEIEKIPQHRLAEPYEQLRIRAKQITEKTGTVPSVAMLCLGDLKQHKPRVDFMKGFLAPGGICAVESKPIFSLEDARVFLTDLNSNYVCFCGTNEQYEVVGHKLLIALKTEFPGRTFMLAGLPESEAQVHWLKEGISTFVHLKCNCYETISAILAGLEVGAVETQA